MRPLKKIEELEHVVRWPFAPQHLKKAFLEYDMAESISVWKERCLFFYSPARIPVDAH
jgi:hypothetical protein